MTTNLPKARELFLHAVGKLPPEQWEAYIAEVCGADTDLAQLLRDLLQLHREAGSFLESPAPGLGATLNQLPLERLGTQIGPYKLLQQIGEGGMGVVYMAEQTEPIARRVALKIIKPGMDTRQVLARFEAERQALSLMDHPNIAKVLDAGTTDSGRPYFVMELVKGQSITQYCDEHHLTPRQRLELFVLVCQAIQHAHQKGIIHRDIKPSNVLVAEYDQQPVPKVIDFGVAKATSQALTEKTMFTGFGQIVGTLEYMSPEQAKVNQLDIDTRSDIYSLGVLLYELLTGSTPFDKQRLRSAAFDEMLRIIREEEPEKPSTRLSDLSRVGSAYQPVNSVAHGPHYTSLASIAALRQTEPAKLTRLVRGELDWIVMKALEKDRSRRFETASGLAADIRHYLNDEAVVAGPPSAIYRFRKFARRNRGRLVAMGVLVVAFLVVVSGVGWAVRDRSARQADAARQQATRQAKVAEQVESIMAEVDRLEREQKWPEALAAARRAEAATVSGETDAETAARVRERLKDHEFIDRLEQIRMNQATWVNGGFNVAAADREYALAFRDYGVDVEALAVETSIDRLKTRPTHAIALAAALDDWTRALWGLEKRDAAQRLLDVARGIDPELLRDRFRSIWVKQEAERRDEMQRLAESINIRGQRPGTLKHLADGLIHVNHPDLALRLLREAQSVYPGDFWINFKLAHYLSEQKDYEGAVRFLTAAVSIRPNTVAALNNLGAALNDRGNADAAVAAYQRAIEIDPKFANGYYNLAITLAEQKKLPEAVTAYQKAIELEPKSAKAYYNVGIILNEQKKLPEAVAAYQRAIEIEPRFASAYFNLGHTLAEQKKLQEAVTAYQKAIELDPKSASAYFNLGKIQAQQRRLSEAIANIRKAIEHKPKSADYYSFLGSLLLRQGKLDEAIAAYHKAIELDPKFALAYHELGGALTREGKLDEAIAAYHKAIEYKPNYSLAFANLGNALLVQGKLDKALAACRKAIEQDPESAHAYHKLGLVLHAQKKPSEAIAAYRKAIELDPEYAIAYCNLGLCLLELKKPDEAITAFRRAIELDLKFAAAYRGLGLALRGKKKLDEAIECFHKAIEIDPRDAGVHNNLGALLCDERHEYDKAIECFRKAIELDPKLAGLYLNLALALQKQQKSSEAIAALKKALTLDEQFGAAHNVLAWILATCPDNKLRDPVQAVASAKKAVELEPNHWAYPNTLGVAHYCAGDWKAALAALEKSMAMRNGGDSSDWFFLAMARWKLGEKDMARQWYDRAVQWMEKNQPTDEELSRFRAEAAELLGIEKQQD